MTADPEIVWKRPPRQLRRIGVRRYRGARVAAQLRMHPGEWALIGTFASDSTAASRASQIRRAYRSASTKADSPWAPAGSFEAVADGCEVYARFMGDVRDE